MTTETNPAKTLPAQKPEPWLILPGTTIGGDGGTFNVDFVLYNRGRTQSRALNGTVDTGAAYSVAPAATLEQLGIEPDYTETFALADGSEVELGVGKAEIELEGRIRDSYVVFGPDRDTVLLGAMTLEAFGLAADARQGRLIPGRLTLLSSPRRPAAEG